MSTTFFQHKLTLVALVVLFATSANRTEAQQSDRKALQEWRSGYEDCKSFDEIEYCGSSCSYIRNNGIDKLFCLDSCCMGLRLRELTADAEAENALQELIDAESNGQ